MPIVDVQGRQGGGGHDARVEKDGVDPAERLEREGRDRVVVGTLGHVQFLAGGLAAGFPDLLDDVLELGFTPGTEDDLGTLAGE